MATIIKSITGLKPNQDYLIVLKAKNTEISAVENPYDAIRIHTPGDTTASSDLVAIDDATFNIYGNYKSVMFDFQPTVDTNVGSYEYELYSDSAGTSLISSGKANASVFTIDVPNNSSAGTDLVSAVDVVYYGRIRPVTTLGTGGPWTPSTGLKESSATALISDQHVSSLTATKITAGTIGSHEIILKQQGVQSNVAMPANMAVIRSSNYNGSFDSNTSIWTSGTSGWIISGDGRAEFSTANIRGTIKAGSVYIDTNNRWKSSEFGDTITDAIFKVGNSTNYMYYNGVNALEVKGKITATTGKIAGWDIDGNNLVSGAGYNGDMVIGPGAGPASEYPGAGTTGAVTISAGTSAAGRISLATFSGYGATIERDGQGPYLATRYQFDGVKYQYSEDKFEFRIIGSTPYIVINGTQFPLTTGAGAPSGGESSNSGGSGSNNGGGLPACSCTNSATSTGVCDVELLCNGPGCWDGCRYNTYDYYTTSCVVSSGCTCTGSTCGGTVVTRGCSSPTVCQ
jgi:hypothetical protein